MCCCFGCEEWGIRLNWVNIRCVGWCCVYCDGEGNLEGGWGGGFVYERMRFDCDCEDEDGIGSGWYWNDGWGCGGGGFGVG